MVPTVEQSRRAQRLRLSVATGEVVLVGVVVAWIGILAWLSIARYTGYNAGMLDLGVMAQSVWSATQGELLVHTAPDIGQRSRLNVHVELFYFLLVPFYALWSDPRLLLIFQAAMFGLGAIPVYRLAMRRLEHQLAARLLVLIYLFYPVALTAVLFDFHGDTLAMPLLLFALEALDRRAWRSYWLFLVLALSCKFHVAAPVALLGPVIWLTYRERRVAIATSVAGLLYGALAFLVIRPLFAVGNADGPQSSGGYLAYYFGDLQALLATLDLRFLIGLVILGPPLLVAWRGWRWLLPAVPMTLAALFSTGPGGSYHWQYHHYALLVPFVVMACLDGVLRQQGRALGSVQPAAQQRRSRRHWAFDLVVTTGLVIIMAAALVDIPLNPQFWDDTPGGGLGSALYGVTARDALKDRFLAEAVPPAVSLATNTTLAPHLANREVLYLTRYADDPGAERLPRVLPRVDYVLTDALFDYTLKTGDDTFLGGAWYDREAIALMFQEPDFGLVRAHDGLLLFQRAAPADRVLANEIQTLPDNAEPALRKFGDALELVKFNILDLGGGRIRLEYTWRVLRSLEEESIFAVTRFAETPELRFVHLPGLAMLQTHNWPTSALIRESFAIEAPPVAAGTPLTVQVGWYRADLPVSAQTDERSLLSGSSVQTITNFRSGTE